MDNRPSLLTIGVPSRKRIRPMSFSACFISSMARFSKYLCSFSYPQLAHISEWTMYWLMAVNSSDNSEFNVPSSFSFPFIDVTSRGFLKGWSAPRAVHLHHKDVKIFQTFPSDFTGKAERTSNPAHTTHVRLSIVPPPYLQNNRKRSILGISPFHGRWIMRRRGLPAGIALVFVTLLVTAHPVRGQDGPFPIT